MFEPSKGFRPVTDYGKDYRGLSTAKLLTCGNRHTFQFKVEVFVDIIISDYILHEEVQLGESLKEKIRVLHKTVLGEEEQAQLYQYGSVLQAVRRKCIESEQRFYLSDAMLPSGSLRTSYESLRQSLSWYLREQLVEDCARRGGVL